ncbi:MAG: hypothetical protein PHF86_00410 [Candidatus Nanoarchaeia archaeon]|nr:hypothetical protein [Candidatus Nanoarchaeia archaeon]
MKNLKSIILKETKKYGIKIIKWNIDSEGCSYKPKKIEIPCPINEDTLGVCFHEIGHIVLKHFDNQKKKRYIEEYESEQFAIQKLKQYGFDYKTYELRAINYVLFKIAWAKNKGHKMSEVPREIIRWTRLTPSKWDKAYRVKISLNENYWTSKSDLLKKVEFYY